MTLILIIVLCDLFLVVAFLIFVSAFFTESLTVSLLIIVQPAFYFGICADYGRPVVIPVGEFLYNIYIIRPRRQPLLPLQAPPPPEPLVPTYAHWLATGDIRAVVTDYERAHNGETPMCSFCYDDIHPPPPAGFSRVWYDHVLYDRTWVRPYVCQVASYIFLKIFLEFFF
jgi:hypothetical protein